MNTARDMVDRQNEMFERARSRAHTPFDYIIVGAGAAGGPLAARLAENGKAVLLIEAGIDPLNDAEAGSAGNAAERTKQSYSVPAFHGAATEDPSMSWEFSVRHFADSRQKRDKKYVPERDPSTTGGIGQGGILYPRASGLGGCTTHHAMIVVRPNDSDWNAVADITQDASWRAENMQGYFARIENCLYYEKFEGVFGKFLFLYKYWKRLLTFINPKLQLSRGGHGRNGWQHTSFIDPSLIWRIAKGDKIFRSLLVRVTIFLLMQDGRWRRLGQFLKTLRIVQLLDPNYGTARSALSAQLSFIPVGTNGKVRVGVRERLIAVSKQHPLRLVIRTRTFAKRVVFENAAPAPPRAVGVEVTPGYGLYEAAKDRTSADPGTLPSMCLFAREEIILCGGAFNSAQLLMLSGIGDTRELTDAGVMGVIDANRTLVAPIVDLPGVGRNLQDRYEVAIVSRTKKEFATLKGAEFEPLNPSDPALNQWREAQEDPQKPVGLYGTNGGALSFFLASKHAPMHEGVVDPDLFIFGAPAAFRGYYWNWSKELLCPTMGATVKKRDLWTWLILKAYTSNPSGMVKLRSSNPFQQAEICFNSFPEGSQHDIEAVREGVEFVRRLNEKTPCMSDEMQPGRAVQARQALEQWIQDEAWGHHACGTCRMGADEWRPDVARLSDRLAVLDSKFRVQGVQRLRVVDASVFPKIPGYFIVTPIFMVAEKAADELLASSGRQRYPARLEEREAYAVRARRARNRNVELTELEKANAQLPNDTVGLALSGGGIRSATFCLGVLQALAQQGRLRQIDFLSTVSGGGYTGAFLGRLFTRTPKGSSKPAERVEKIVGAANSAEVKWLRDHANYISGGGRTDQEVNLGVVWRSLLGAHLCLAAMFIGVFCVLRWLTDNTVLGAAGTQLFGLTVTPWWWFPAAIFVLGIYPSWLAFWLAQKPGNINPHPVFGLFCWLVMLGAAVAALRLEKAGWPAFIGITSLIVAWLWQELARIGAIKDRGLEGGRGIIVRNRLTRGLGFTLAAFTYTTLWVVLDSLARLGAQRKLMLPLVGAMGVLAAIMPFLRASATKLGKSAIADPALMRNITAGVIAFPLLAFLLFGYDVIAHTSFEAGARVGWWTAVFALLIALVLSRASGFLNLTSLNAHYASRLARTFLGASNAARVHAVPGEGPPDVTTAHAEDDVFLSEYRPDRCGGPLHLMSVCVNETVDALSSRSTAEDKGLTLCVGPAGVSVGRRFHAVWQEDGAGAAMFGQKILREMEDTSGSESALCPLPAGPDPNAFHPLSRDPMRDDEICVLPERLRLSQWMAISGAAFTPGQGRHTSLPMALLLGLFNVRLGYWWDSGVETGDRPGRYPPTFLRRLSAIPQWIFRTQATLLSEWWRRFHGPTRRLWYLSDGGHIENSGLYELLRRRVRFMIMVDGTHDPGYIFDDLAALVRRARLDFGASFDWIDPASASIEPPQWLTDWIDARALASMESLKREGPHSAALARIGFRDDAEAECWLLVVKGCLAPADMPLDVRCYATLNGDFPNQSTLDQFLSDEQWESYRVLGEQIGNRIFAQPGTAPAEPARKQQPPTKTPAELGS